jgi:hypothetical protein
LGSDLNSEGLCEKEEVHNRFGFLLASIKVGVQVLFLVWYSIPSSQVVAKIVAEVNNCGCQYFSLHGATFGAKKRKHTNCFFSQLLVKVCGWEY